MKRIILLGLLSSSLAFGQTSLPLTDLSDFESKSSNWKIAGEVNVDINTNNTISTKPGTGVLVCEHQQGKYGTDYDLFSRFSHGDMDIDLEFMMAKGSNSGIYLQSRYEIQLNDSWGAKTPKYFDCGGIYQRWDDTKPEAEKGYEGYAPRNNVSKAPGLWQKMTISFQAPRFDAAGKKIENAKILFIKLNGIIIHENVSLSGVTRGSVSEMEVASAPLRIQGDHGSVAFRNIVINSFDKKAGSIKDLSYQVYYGSYAHNADLSTLKMDEKGNTPELTWEVTKKPNDYAFIIKGKYWAPTTGKYEFTTQLGGNSMLKIDNQEILPNNWTVTSEQRKASINLTEGEHTFEIFNNKRDGWLRPGLGFWSAGPGFRQVPHHSLGSLMASGASDPILLTANTPNLLRSFMDFEEEGKKKRIVHAVSMGTPANIHFTYDMDKGALFQIWKGAYLDASPMWNDRGDGSSKPIGSLCLLSDQVFIGKGKSTATDTTTSGYKPLGYELDEEDMPTFRYKIFGNEISDKIRISKGKMVSREIVFKSNDPEIFGRLAKSSKIEKVGDNLYAIDDKSYFIQINTGHEAGIVDGNLLVVKPADNKIIYSILF